jgi:hypothetical protein
MSPQEKRLELRKCTTTKYVAAREIEEHVSIYIKQNKKGVIVTGGVIYRGDYWDGVVEESNTHAAAYKARTILTRLSNRTYTPEP